MGNSRIIFSGVDLSATMESRICIVGENGAGKTTLLKMIMDIHTPWRGTRTAHRDLKFGYFTQHFVDQLDMTICPVEVMQREFPGKKVEEYRRMLGQFGVTGDMALQQIESLSGGQKSRVAFAVLCGHSPNFLIDIYLLNGKTCGYAKYAGKESAEKAVSALHGQEVCGARLKVMPADPQDKNDNTRKRPKMMEQD